jgi:triacylglycerol lipase
MSLQLNGTCAACGIALVILAGPAHTQDSADALTARLDRLEANVQRAEDVSAIKRLQRTYGYYLDKGMWADLAEFFTEDAVANYPAGVYIGKPSIRRHLFMNVGGGEMGDIGLGNRRLYNHMNIQPVVHLDPGGATAKGRWRAFAMFGSFGGGATWAEGVYEMTYAKENGVWKIKTLDYHSGFGAPYATGWVNPGPRRTRGGPRNLPHPADRERNMPCEGFPDACLAPFHYENPGTSAGGLLWTDTDAAEESAGRRGNVRQRAGELARRAALLRDEQEIENLQRIYGYYLDRGMWDQIADLFADDGTIEMGLQGVYVGRPRIREFLGLLGPDGGRDGWLNDHVQLQGVATVAPDGQTARLRSRELNMTGVHGSHAQWSEGIYENTFVKEDGVWKFKSLHYFPTFISDYEKGWAQDAQPVPTASTELPPDRPPTDVYEIFPKAHIPAYHYRNPITGAQPQYPREQGRPSREAIRAATAPVQGSAGSRGGAAVPDEAVDSVVAEAERLVMRFKDYHELENLESAYGYYLDKNLWNDLADLFAADGSMELAQRGIYKGNDRVRGFLLSVFGRGGEGPVEGRLGNHLQMQPVIHISPDGRSAKLRARMMQQLTFGERASMGASVYENEAVKENGVWKFSVVHTYNTWTAGYAEGWAKSQGGVPGPSTDYPPDGPPTFEFAMFPTVYDIPFHYRNPVSGRVAGPTTMQSDKLNSRHVSAAPGSPGAMPLGVAAEISAIGARIEAQRTAEIYAPLQPKEPYSGVAVARDLSYGPAERNVLDVFSPTPTREAMPILVFVHGGGFSRGAKSSPGSPFYDNVMLWAASEGMLGVNINYRLAPEHSWPSGIEDLTALVAWLRTNAAAHGGDPERIFLWGHSAGAAHVGDYIAHRTLRGEAPGIAGAILTSGFYELGDEVSVWQAYYGADVSTYPERSSLAGLTRAATPLLLSDAEFDPEIFQQQTRLLAGARAEAGRPVTYLHLLGHSHISETYAIGTEDRALSDPVLAFIHDLR